MSARDMTLAALTSVIWGLGFVAIRFGLDSFSAPQLTAVRFLIAGLPVFLVSRPRISWVSLVLIGMTLFTGQFLLLFFAYTQGMPPGLASVSQHLGEVSCFIGDLAPAPRPTLAGVGRAA
jgi:O-acetylserine/cysteine efflux transporter